MRDISVLLTASGAPGTAALIRALRMNGDVLRKRCEYKNSGAGRIHHRRLPHSDGAGGIQLLVITAGQTGSPGLVSLPYLNYGGPVADDETISRLLIDAASQLADKWNVRYLELRHELAIEHPAFF